MNALPYLIYLLFPSVVYALFAAAVLRVAKIKGCTFPVVFSWCLPYSVYLSVTPITLSLYALHIQPSYYIAILVSMNIGAVFAAIPVYLLTQKWWAAIAPIMITAISAPIVIARAATPSGMNGNIIILIGLAWHVAIAGSLILWAVRHRAASRPKGLCQSCGYDQTGLSSNQCPECGEQIQPSEVSP